MPISRPPIARPVALLRLRSFSFILRASRASLSLSSPSSGLSSSMKSAISSSSSPSGKSSTAARFLPLSLRALAPMSSNRLAMSGTRSSSSSSSSSEAAPARLSFLSLRCRAIYQRSHSIHVMYIGSFTPSGRSIRTPVFCSTRSRSSSESASNSPERRKTDSFSIVALSVEDATHVRAAFASCASAFCALERHLRRRRPQ